jgi:predicted DNA-binding protein (MmcQ/YjbR family)
MSLSRRTVALQAYLDAMPGAIAKPLSLGRASTSGVLIYKIMGKMFAILSIRGVAFVILKCDRQLAEVLREQYTGVGHRSHLDRRYWISVTLDADVPIAEIRRLVRLSHELVCAKLTRKQQAALAIASAP